MKPASPILAALRQATWAWHQRLNHHPTLAALVKPGLSLGEYTLALRALYPALVACEHWVLTSPEAHLYPFLPRSSALVADLHALLPADQLPSTSPKLVLPHLSGSIWGVLYVLEGARLGGQRVHRMIQQQLPYAPCAFFTATVVDWLQFSQLTTRYCMTAAAQHAACEAAVIAFQYYYNTLIAPRTVLADPPSLGDPRLVKV